MNKLTQNPLLFLIVMFLVGIAAIYVLNHNPGPAFGWGLQENQTPPVRLLWWWFGFGWNGGEDV